jgi:high affinity Mn2+ porin
MSSRGITPTSTARSRQGSRSTANRGIGRTTRGIAGVVNGISSAHTAYFNAGGLGIVIGDGQLPHPGLEQIIETYYSYALSPSTRVSFDHQFIANPAYNTDRGPVNVFAGRFHWQF